jgi:hypothetical protein
MTSPYSDDRWGGLLAVDETTYSAETDNPYRDGDADEIVLEEQLPFTRFKLPPEEEDIDTIRTGTSQYYPRPFSDRCTSNSSGVGSEHSWSTADSEGIKVSLTHPNSVIQPT